MSEKFTLPPPGFLKTEILNLGPALDPKFTDANDWNEFMPRIETTPVAVQHRSMAAVDEARAAAPVIALANYGVRDLIDGKRYEIISIGTRAVDRTTEFPVVVLYNYDDNVTVEAIVDPAVRDVREVRTTTNQPAVSDAETDRAIELVRRDGRLPDGGVDVGTGRGLIVEETDFHSPRYGHRLVDLRFGPADRRLPTAFAIVDLSTEAVVEVGLIPEGLL
ncbi:hypothetical protein [Nocardia sp. NPDC051832]|uniref:hypothetical protein n=1 Tax=Nocardia sp. NPDC051832 TaxID=3155673 RepID=UPI00343E018A